jgi:acetyl-CoA/propionyl-CoA carboxylase biotin carboxyl carrier protein
VTSGTVIGPVWDSLLAKLIVTGADREQALRRAARALAEFEIEGMPTVLPFHRAVVVDPAFAPELTASSAPFSVHTQWIQTEFRNTIAPYDGDGPDAAAAAAELVVVEVGGKRLEVRIPATLAAVAPPAATPAVTPRRATRAGRAGGGASDDAVRCPMQGTVVQVAVREGDCVNEGDLVVMVEAMKMEQPILAHRTGQVLGLRVEVGQSISAGTQLCRIGADHAQTQADSVT